MIDAAFHTEFEHFRLALTAAHDTTGEALQTARGQHRRLVLVETGRFWKAVTLFPCGLVVAARAGKVLDDIYRDARFKEDLATAVQEAKAYRPQVASFRQSNKFTFPERAIMKHVLEVQTIIMANASKPWLL